MNGATKLPYKVKFQLDYQQYNQRLSRLLVPPLTGSEFGVSDELLKVVQELKQKIKDQELQFTPSNIFTQYASPALLNEGKKNASQLCPGCGQDNKKPVQCQFCGIMYCKNCCSRKRVLPNLSQPKDARIQCQDCHGKFVKLLANQAFYQQASTFNKIIDSTNNRLKKLQKQTKTKKDRIEAAQKKKKQLKMREGIILKQLKNQQKRIQDLQQKLQQTVKQKAEALRKQQQRKQMERKKQQQQQQQQRKRLQNQQQNVKKKMLEEQLLLKMKKQLQQQKIKRQLQIQEALRKQKQLENQTQQMKRKQEETDMQLEKQNKQIQLQKEKQRQKLEKKRKEQQKRLKQLKQLELQKQKRLLQQEEHKKEANDLRNLAKNMLKQNQSSNEKQAPVLMVASFEPVVKIQESPQSNLKVNNSYENSPLKVISSFNGNDQTDNKITTTTSKKSENITKSINLDQKQSQKASLSESTQKLESASQDGKKDPINLNQDLQNFKNLPPIAINISQMTVNQLLDININPYTNQPLKRRQSLRDQRRLSQLKLAAALQSKPEVNQISAQQKYQILRSSNISSSLIHSTHQEPEEEYQNPDPTGSKCNCTLM